MIKINKNIIFDHKRPPLIIAEISGNHGGNKKRFMKLIDTAYSYGADLVKIQTYEPKDITLNKKDNFFKIKSGIWKNKYLWDLYKSAYTPFNWHKDAFELAKKHKKILFSSPFSIRAVDLLEDLDCKLYKIASFEITDLKLVNYIASKKKPIIISTGMASIKEIKSALKEIRKYHNKIIILHCVSSYPTKLEDINLQRVNKLKNEFNSNQIGLSDHTNDIISSLLSLPYGVVAIEKHFKINNKFRTPDSTFSITPDQLFKLKKDSNAIYKSLKKKNNNSEKISIKLRRSIFAKENIEKNTILTRKNIETFRPLVGICASKYFEILGKKVNKKIKKGEPIFSKFLRKKL